MAQKVKVSTYIKNVGASFGYSVKEVANDYAPITISTARDFKSTARDIKISMQEIKNNNISNATKDFSKGENFLSNTLDDLRTGKWYNQERKDKAENEMFGFDSFDFNFDDEDWGDDSDPDGVDTSSILEHDEMSTNQIISSMGQVGSEISKSLGYTSAKSAEYIVANNNASTRALYDLNAKGFNQVSSILMNMSGNIAGLVQLGEPLAAHMQNSSVFYTHTTESLNRISEDVNKMSSNLQILVDRTAYMDKKGSVKENKNGFGRFMSGGDFSLSSYMDMVKENVKDQADSVKSIISMMEMMMGKNGKNASLTEAIVKGTVDKLIPTITKDIAKQFDEALSASLGNGLMRAGKSARNKGFLASILADILLPKEVVKNGVNPSNYEKGPVSWDGIARQSLTYVIPTYLAQMTALLAGVNDEKDYQYYDFKSGKFTTKRVYQRDKEVRDRARARSVGGEFEDIALKSTGNKQMQKEIEEFFYQAMLNGGNFYDIKKGKTDADWRKKYGNISEETVELLLQVLEANNGKGPNKNRNAASKWETRNNQAIADNARRMQEEELLGYSFENRFADGTSDFVLRSAVGSGRGKGRGAGERNQSVYRTPFNDSRESVNSGNGWRQNSDGTYTVGPNDAIITAADFGKWLDAFESGDVKTARKIENTKAMKDTKEKASSMAKNIGSKVMDKVGINSSKATNVMDLLERGRDVIQTPMYAVTMALDSLNRGINNLFWGDGSEEGVIDKLKKKISSVWDKIKDKFDDLFGTKSYRTLKDMGLSDQFVDIVRTVDKRGYIRYFGVDVNGKKTPVSNEVGKTYEEQTRKKTLKESMANEWTKIKESFKNQQQAARQKRETLSAELAKFKEMSAGFDNGNAATGRQVTKAGFAIVSEGEMIVPSEFNPYYHGATNKASQIANEDRIRRNFFGSFAKGGVPAYNKINGNIYTDNKGGYYEYDSETKKYNKIDIKDGEGRKKVASGYKNAIASSGPVGAISEGAKTLAGGIMDFINGIMGKNDKKAQEQEKKDIFASIKQSFIDAGNEKGALGIGAVTGVGVSLLTGAVVGPLAGAAIGAGVGLAAKSQAFQDLLFGKGDPESDDYRKGLLGSIGEKLKDKNNQEILKNTGIGGGTGLIAGTLMGSPILGLITGSTIGYISKSQKAQEFLFGTEDEKTALGELKDKVKEVSPNIAAGALAGLIAGPFGVVGNLLVGSGLGYITTTDRFKKLMFGDEETGEKGLATTIHDKIVDPLDNIMHNISISTKTWLKNTGKLLTNRLNSFFKDRVKRYKDGEGGFLNNLIGIGDKVIKAPINIAGAALGKISERTTKKNLERGYNVWNSKAKRESTAEERMALRQEKGVGSSSLDEAIASVKSKQELLDLKSALADLEDPSRVAKRFKNKSLSELYSVLHDNGVSSKDADKIAKLITGDNGLARAKQYLAKCEIKKSDNKTAKQQEKEIVAALSKANEEILKAQNQKDITKNTRQMLKDKYGIKDSDRSLINAGSLIDSELKNNDKFSEKGQAEQKLDKHNSTVETYLDQILQAIKEVGMVGKEDFDNKRAGKITVEKDNNGNNKYYRLNSNGEREEISEEDANYQLDNDKSRTMPELLYDAKETVKSGTKTVAKTGVDIVAETGREMITAAKIMADSASAVASFVMGQVDEGMESADNAVANSRKAGDYRGNGLSRVGRKISNGLTRAKGFVKGVFSKKSDEGEESGAGSSTYNRIIRSLSAGDSGEDPDRKTEFTNNGPIQYVKSSQGEWVVDRSDNETKSTMKKQEEFNKSISGIGKITGILGGIGGALGLLKKGLLGDGEKKPGLLSKLFSGLFGEEGAISGILSLFTGEKGSVKTLVRSILAKGGASIFKTMLTDIGIGALIYAGFSGKLDSIASSITGLIGGKGAEDAFASESKDKSTTYDVTLQDGSTTTASKDKNGNFVDANGNVLNVKSVDNANQNNVASFSDKLKENTARGILTNRKTTTGALLSKTSIGKKVTNFVTENADDLGIAIFTQIDDALIKVAGALKKIPVLKNVDLDGMFGTLSKKIGDVITSQSAANIAKFASNAVVIARIAFAVVDFTTGFEDARTTLGIIKEPTTGQKILSGLLRLVKNLIPIVGTLIPDSLVIDVFCNYIAPALGIDVDELKNAREEAQETVDSYNAATGNDLSVAEFTKSVMKDYTWTERVGNAAKGTWEDTKVRAKNFGKSVKENGLGATIKNMGTDFISEFKDSYDENGGGISGSVAGMGDAWGKMLPGVFGEISTAIGQINSSAFKGDLKGVWSVALKDFSGGGEDIEGTDVKTAVPSLFSKIIGQIPLLLNKLVATPIALVSKVLGKLKEVMGPAIDKVKEFGSGIATITGDNVSYVAKGDITGLWSSQDENGEDKENPLGKFGSVFSGIEKVVFTIPTAISWVGHKVHDGFVTIVTKVKNSISAIQTSFRTGFEEITSGNGNITNFMDVSNITEDPENPVGGFTTAICKVARFVSLPAALFKWVGDKVKSGIDSIKQKIATASTNIGTNYLTVHGLAESGDVSGLWDNEIQDDEGNPLGGVYKAVNFMQKLSSTPLAAFKWVGGKVKEFIDTAKGKIVSGYSTITSNLETIQGYANDGDVGAVWDNEIQDDEGNPLGGLFKAVNFMQKLSNTPLATFKFVGNKISESLHIDSIKQDASTFNDAIKTISGYAKDGDLSSIWDTEASFTEDNPVKTFFSVGITINKVFSSIVALFNKIIDPIKDMAEGLAESVGEVADTIGEGVDTAVDTASSAAKTAADWAGDKVDAAANAISGLFGGRSGLPAGGDSGFVNQFDPRYQQYSVSGQSFGAKGCGPAVASMTASALGKNLSVGDAVRASNGYQTNNGVTLDYFQNALGSRGINTEIIAGGSSADMYRKIASGEKVILLGQDANNTSKKNSPFGPNNHYVLATGVDRRGNIIVNDPESKGPRTYSPSILANAKYGIAGSNSGIKSNRTSKIFRFISGAGNPRNDAITQQIWAYLTTKLGMSEAAAAGVMGNMEQESGCQPDIKQMGGGSAYGLCQWDGGRRDKLKQFPNYQSLSVQLDYLASELPSQYWSKSGTINDVDGKSYSYRSMSYDDFAKLTDVAEATIKFQAAFERAGKPHLANRINYAKAYYEMFSGKTYTIDPSIGTATSSGVTDSNSSISTSSTGSGKSGGIFNILNTISSAFTNAFRGGTEELVTKENSQENQTSGVISNSSSNSALIGTGNSATGDMVNNFPYYNQGEEPWQGESYGTGTIKSSGCGPTSMAMVMKSYGNNVTPSDTAKWSVQNGYRVPNQGTSWGFFKGIGDKYGLDVSQFGSSDTAKQSLLAGVPVIGSMKPGDFTKGGHFIVFSGISKDGSKVYVNDPASRTRSGKVWDTNNAFSQAKQFWAVSKDGKGSINTSAAGSGILSYGDLAMAAGGSSGLLMSSRAGANTPGVATFRDSKTGRLLPVRVSGGESDIVGMTSTMLNNVKTSVSNAVGKAKSGTVSAELVAELLKSITNILNNIADNTAPVAKIYNALAAYISSGGGASMDKVTVKKKPETPVAGGGSNEIDSNIAALAGVLAELAKG